MHVDPTNIEGMWRDFIYRKGPDGQDVLVQVTPWKKNRITQPFTYLAAGLLLGEPSFTGGILQHAIGVGDASWDTSLPEPGKFDVALFDEVSRRVPDQVYYVKTGTGTALSGTLTTIVDPSRVSGGEIVGRCEPDDFFNTMTVTVTDGTNAGVSRVVSDYAQASGTITVPAFPLPIDNTSVYEFTPVLSGTPTNVVEVTTIWDYGIPADPFNGVYIREMGLFGGTATATVDSGLMLDRITHARIWKDENVKLRRVIDVTLRV